MVYQERGQCNVYTDPDSRKEPIIAHFDEKWIPEPNTGCHLWTAAVSTRGYGHYSNGKKMVRAHRHAYERVNGPVPEGLVLDHLCRQKLCVNPEHLEAVTQRENLRRGVNTFVTNPGGRWELRR